MKNLQRYVARGVLLHRRVDRSHTADADAFFNPVARQHVANRVGGWGRGRVLMERGGQKPIGAYLATRGALVALSKLRVPAGAKIKSVAIPGMCTGVGGMPFHESAAQMRAAFASA